MDPKKAIIIDFDCIDRPFDGSDAGLVEYVLATDSDLDNRVCDIFEDFIYFRLGLGERSLLAYLMGYLRKPESLVRDLSKVGASDGFRDDDYFLTIEALRELAKQAGESGSYKNQFYEDFPIAAADWIERGFKIVIFSKFREAEYIRNILVLAGIQQDTSIVSVRCKSDLDMSEVEFWVAWIAKIVDELDIELAASFLIVTEYFHAREIRLHCKIKTAVLTRGIRPFEEHGYYLNIGSLLDIDPEPDGVDSRVEVDEKTRLSDFLTSKTIP